VIADFEESTGGRLQAGLDALGHSAPDYLGLLLFVDGSAERPCERGRIAAWTQPGSRVVRICGDRFVEWRRTDPALAEMLLIHEALHTLGLGENPPSSLEITAAVRRRCGQD
jgi:hypothetical protein